MSEGVRLISFCCHYGGKFDKVNGHLAYVGGGVRFIDTKAEDVLSALMNELPISLYGQRVFYKLPFEGYEDMKILLNGHPNFQKMCEASVYTGAIDIAIEPDVEEENGETENQNEDGSAIRYDEEERVEREVGHLSDDAEFSEYDGFSDDSEVEIGGKNYCKYKKGSGEFVLGQVFDSLDDFKEGVLDYSLKNQRNIHYCRWDQDKSEVRCAYVPEEDKEPCSWRLYCSVEVPLQKWMVKTFYSKHVCPETRFSKIVTDQVIAKLFLHDIRIDHNYMPRRIQREVEQRWNKVVTLDQCRNARRKALEMLRSEHEEQFTRLRDYRAELLRSNEGSTVELETVRGDDGTDLFLRFYDCFA